MRDIPDPNAPTTGIATEHLHRYRTARTKIDPEIRLIHSLTAVLAKFEEFDRDRISVDPVALGQVHRTLEQSVLAIWRELDDFLLVEAVERALASRKDAE